MKKIVIFIGPPGSGKGTQAKQLAQKFNYGHISTGDLLRALQTQTEIEPDEAEALKAMKQGKLVPDWLIYRLAFKAAEEHLNNGRGVVFDGAIRNTAQAATYQEYFTGKNLAADVVVVEIALSDEDAYNRLTKRRICKECGAIIPWLPEFYSVSTCPKCGGELTARADDSEEVIRKRIKEQGNEALSPIRDYYQQLNLLKIIDGGKAIAEVEKDVVAAIS